MDTIFTFQKIYSFLLATLLMVCFQESLLAQITVCNETGCAISVQVVQNDYSTFAPCDLCFSNPFAPVNIPNGECVEIYGQDECNEQWQSLRWTIASSATIGTTYNPALGGACGSNTLGPLCNAILPTSATWTTTGPNGSGPAEVLIQ